MKKYIIFLALVFLSHSHIYAQISIQPTLSTGEHKKVIDAINQKLGDNYVFPEVAKKMANSLTKNLKKGRYKKINDPDLFASTITEDLIAISHDKHIRVRFNPQVIQEQAAAVTEEQQEQLRQKQIRQYQINNYGFKSLKILDGNIGYLDLRGFTDASVAGDTAVAAMNYLSNTDAIIFDLRHNGGGNPSMIQLLISYLYGDEPVHLNNFYWRPSDTTTQTWTLPHVPGKKNPDAKVYVLTSGSTFSAAEEFSYNLKNLERAILVGETTGGGAHPGDMVAVTDRFQLWLPSGRAINPISQTNWEGTGVSPHIEISQEKALDKAYAHALKTLLAESTNKDDQLFYQWTLDRVNAKIEPIMIDENTLMSYAGTYGPRKILFENSQLYHQRGQGPKYQLIALSKEKFALKDIPYLRLVFEESSQEPTTLIGHYSDGRQTKDAKNTP